MGTDGAPYLANLFLYYYEWNFMDRLVKAKDLKTATLFNKTSRYIDDLFTLNNDGAMNELMDSIYPPELKLNKENDDDSHTTFLDLSITIEDERLTHTLYDKRDAFSFKIVNYPHLCGNVNTNNAYGVFIGQLIRYANACMSYDQFLERTRVLISKLVTQHFRLRKLSLKLEVFYKRHFFTVCKYGKSLLEIRKDLNLLRSTRHS